VEQILRKEGNGLPVQLVGFVENDQIPKHLLECHAVVLLSDHEGLGLSLLEGMASGVVRSARSKPARIVGTQFAPFSFRELDRWLNQIGKQLGAAGIEPHSRVGIMLPHGPEGARATRLARAATVFLAGRNYEAEEPFVLQTSDSSLSRSCHAKPPRY